MFFWKFERRKYKYIIDELTNKQKESIIEELVNVSDDIQTFPEERTNESNNLN